MFCYDAQLASLGIVALGNIVQLILKIRLPMRHGTMFKSKYLNSICFNHFIFGLTKSFGTEK